jgi:putative ABC transport system permease protein
LLLTSRPVFTNAFLSSRPCNALLEEVQPLTPPKSGYGSGLALVLAVVGIYGVISHVVSLRTRELGIRIALGAARRDLMEMVLRQGLKPVGLGLMAGFAASVLLTRFLSSLLFQVRPIDFVTSLGVTVTLAAAALPANYLPARRASRVDPVLALRCE